MGAGDATARWLGTAGLLLAGVAGACVLPDVDLAGRPCPCAAGYTCDEATDTCVEGDGAASSTTTSTATSTPTSGEGPASTSGPSSSGSESSAGGGGGSSDGGSGPGSTTSATTSAGGGEGGATVTTTTGGGGGGGEGGCAPGQTLGVPPCSDVSETFTDGTTFFDAWTLQGNASGFIVENGTLRIEATSTTLVAYAPGSFDIVGCGITLRIDTPPDVDGYMARLSIGVVGEMSSYNIGVIDDTLQARDGTTVLEATAYDPEVHRYVRIREDGGTIFFATSGDGICWDEVRDIAGTALGVNARISLFDDGGTGATAAVFDDYNAVP